MRRMIILAAALTLAVVPGASSAGRTLSYRDPDFGWSLSYPAGQRLSVVRADVGFGGSVRGAVVANFSGALADGRFVRFPDDGVAFGFWHPEGSIGPQVEDPEPRFPLGRRTFRRSAPRRQRGVPVPLYRHVVANGSEFEAYVWLGPRSSAAARASLWRVVGSLRFPRLRPGELVGEHFLVMGPARRYRLGSVTRHPLPVEPRAVPFYFVRAPGGFYALGWSSQLYRGYHRCPVRFDRPRFEFFCRENGARWDRMGAVLVNPDPKHHQDDPLDLMSVKRGWDGHLLVNAGWFGSSDRRLARHYWPRGFGGH